MNLADLVAPGRTPACWEKPDVFASEALDYHPAGADYRDLDPDTHAELAAAKTAAEDAAVSVCFECPLMLQCEALDEATCADPSISFVHGVIGGRTERERRVRTHARRTGLSLDEAEESLAAPARHATGRSSVPNPQIAPGDRGPRNQIDDDMVARMTLANKTSEEIARELGCSPRSVTRARSRIKRRRTSPDATQAPQGSRPDQPATPEPTPAPSAITPVAALRDGGDAPRVSPAMAAIFAHLAATGGSGTIEDLIVIGTGHISADDALDWWLHRHSETVNGQRRLCPDAEDITMPQRISDGARAKVRNMLCATARRGRHLTRTGDTVALTADAMATWCVRLHALSA